MSGRYEPLIKDALNGRTVAPGPFSKTGKRITLTLQPVPERARFLFAD